MTKLKRNEFYCVCCRRKVSQKVDEICFEEDVVGNPRLYSNCRKCGCGLYKYVKHSQTTSLENKFGYC